MSVMQFHCPYCSNLFHVDPSLAGQQVACPMCAGVVSLPAMPPEMASLGVEPPAYQEQPPWSPMGGAPIQSPPSFETTSPPLQCPYCTGAFQIPPELAGQQVACPYCQMPVMAPGPPGVVNFAHQPDAAVQNMLAMFAAPAEQEQAPIDLLMPGAAAPPGLNEARTDVIAVPPALEQQPEPAKNLFSEGRTGRSEADRTSRDEPVKSNRLEGPRPAKKDPAEPREERKQGASAPLPKEKPSSKTSHRWKEDQAEAAETAPPPAKTKPSSRKQRAVDALLPPTAEKPKRIETKEDDDAPLRVVKSPQELEALLPPRISSRLPALPGDERALPDANDLIRHSVREDEGEYLFPTDAGYVKLHEPVKTVSDHGKVRTLRRLTPEEKEARQARRNFIVMSICVALLLALLLYFRP